MEPLYHTLQDFFRSLSLPLKQDFEFTVHPLEGLHGDKPMRSPIFRTNYYAFLLIRSGKSNYTIDGQPFELGANSFYFTNPGHLKSFQIEEPLTGFMLTFSERFVKQHFAGDFFQQFPFLVHETTPVMRLDKLAFEELELIFQQMHREYVGKSHFKSAILTNQLSILLFKTKELLLTHKVGVNVQRRSAVLVSEFKNLVNQNFKQLATGEASKVMTVKELADSLNVHPNYLSNTVKEETGKPASEWIQERTLAEAKAMLGHPSKTISEIAFHLGFSDSAHFAKFFKKRTGQPPTAFRLASSL